MQTRRSLLVLVVLLCACASGCGVAVRATVDCESPGWGRTREEVENARGKPDKVIAEAGNQETWIYTLSKNRWCGVLLIAILPLPLILPVCDEQDRVEFAGEEAQKSWRTRLHAAGFIVGKEADARMDDCSKRPG